MKVAKATLATWQNQLPISVKQFHEVAKEVQNKANKKFFESCFNIKDHPEFQKKLEDAVVDILAEFNEANNEASRLKCERALQQIFEPVHKKIKNGDYTKPGGYKLLEAALEKVRTEYFQCKEREEMGPMISDVLLDFNKNKVPLLFYALTILITYLI